MTVPSGYVVTWGDEKGGEEPFREVAPGIGIPVRFRYSLSARPAGPGLTLHVELREREWVPVKLELEAAPGDALTTTNVRVPLARLLQDALSVAAKRLTYDSHDETGRTRDRYYHPVTVVGRIRHDGTRQEADQRAWLLTTAHDLGAVLEPHEPGRRAEPLTADDRQTVRDRAARSRVAIPMTDEDLSAVADRYRALAAGRRNPTIQIANEWHVSRMTASRWLRRARDLGILEEPGSAAG